LHGTGVFLFTVNGLCSDLDVFEKSDQRETPVDRQKSETPIVLQARFSASFGFFFRNKMNHAMKNNSQKISSTSYEVKTPLDSNKEIFPTNFQPPARSAARCLS